MFLREKGLATSSISTMLAAIYHFYEMNDVILNRNKINMFIGEPTLKAKTEHIPTKRLEKF
jgi:hypothetical protein